MIKVLDMQFIRYANLFNQITRIRTKHCFEYNNMIVFVVPRNLVLRAIGQNNSNLEKLSNIIGRKIKVVADPNGIEDIENFVSILVKPIRLKGIEIKDGEAIINSNAQSKASLIGKGKIRLTEMENILGQYFGVRKVRIK
jgi:transcription antitermination factor NusA-like protein